MLKRLSLDKGKKKKKKEVANVSLLNRKYSYFVGNIYATFKRNIFNIGMCGYFGTKKNSFTKLSFRFVST